MAVSKQGVVAKAVEAGRQDVGQEAPHELTDRQSHDFALSRTVLPVILPAKTDMVVVEIEQPAIGDGDAVGVTAQLGENLLRACEWTLGIDHPFDVAQGSKVDSKRV